jgi:hypothetical protein
MTLRAAILLPILLAAPAIADDARLLAAMRQVESGGNRFAVGDGGLARGPLQCHAAAWTDGCKALGVHWPYPQYVWSRWHSEQVARGYWRMYGCKTDEQKARRWNGGVHGDRNPTTLKYWKRVQATMKGQQP